MPYDIGDGFVADLRGLIVLGVSDLGGRTEAIGTVVEKPGAELFNVHLDEPLPPYRDMITFIGVNRL